MYVNRKNLLKYLQENDIKVNNYFYISSILQGYVFIIDEDNKIIYWTDENNYSVHNKHLHCILTSFVGGIIDRKNYKKIKEILEKKIEEYNAK
jgi:hypothetical protein